MSEEKKQNIDEMVDILKDLNADDLALIKGGAMVLKAKQNMQEERLK